MNDPTNLENDTLRAEVDKLTQALAELTTKTVNNQDHINGLVYLGKARGDALRALIDALAAIRAAYTWALATPETMPPFLTGPWLVTTEAISPLRWAGRREKDPEFHWYDIITGEVFPAEGTEFCARPLERSVKIKRNGDWTDVALGNIANAKAEYLAQNQPNDDDDAVAVERVNEWLRLAEDRKVNSRITKFDNSLYERLREPVYAMSYLATALAEGGRDEWLVALGEVFKATAALD